MSDAPYVVHGTTKDSSGSALGSCDVYLCKEDGSGDVQQVSRGTSASSGFFALGAQDTDATHFVIARKEGTPNVFDVSDFGLTPWSPSSLSLAAWYDPSDLTTLFQNSDGTGAVTADGDPVGYMADKSGNGHHLTQATSGSRPVYKTSGGLHWLDFDGTDDKLVGPAMSNYITNSTFESLVAFQADTIGTNVPGNVYQNEAVWGDTTGNISLFLRDTASDLIGIYNFDGSVDQMTTTAAAAAGRIVSFRHQGGSIYLQIGTDSEVSVISGNTSSLTGLFQLGRQFNADTYCMDGRFYGGGWRKTVFTADERALFRAFLALRSGVAL